MCLNHVNVLLVKVEGPIWHTVYHRLPVVKGVVSNPSINQPTNGKRTSMVQTRVYCFKTPIFRVNSSLANFPVASTGAPEPTLRPRLQDVCHRWGDAHVVNVYMHLNRSRICICMVYLNIRIYIYTISTDICTYCICIMIYTDVYVYIYIYMDM